MDDTGANDCEISMDFEVFTDLQESMQSNGPVVAEGFLKFAVKITSMPNNTNVCQGCMADFQMKHVKFV